jgi:hypothetical protein
MWGDSLYLETLWGGTFCLAQGFISGNQHRTTYVGEIQWVSASWINDWLKLVSVVRT